MYTSSNEDKDESLRKKGIWFGSRHLVTFMLFLGMANAYIMRTNMSVTIVVMAKQIEKDSNAPDYECGTDISFSNSTKSNEGEFDWNSLEQGIVLSSFFYGYVLTQIPFGILSKRFGACMFLGIGMLINSVFGLLVPMAARAGITWLMIVRFIQGLGEGPIVPCTHTLLAKWIPPNERSRMGAFVYAGAQFGTVISMPISGLLCDSIYKWPSVFYFFGTIGVIWSAAFLYLIYEDPERHPKINQTEQKYIVHSIWGSAGSSNPKIPWASISKSLPFWAILLAHMGQNYGYETLMTELPSFMKQVLHFNIRDNGILSALPYLAMWILSMVLSYIADYMLYSNKCTHTTTRKLFNTIGQMGPAVALIIASYTGCNPILTVTILTIGVGLNGGIYSGFKINHLDISPRFAGILMSFTNCLANLTGLTAPIVAGYIVNHQPTQAKWRIVFYIAAIIYSLCCLFYLIFGSGKRQKWDNPEEDDNLKKNKNQNIDETNIDEVKQNRLEIVGTNL